MTVIVASSPCKRISNSYNVEYQQLVLLVNNNIINFSNLFSFVLLQKWVHFRNILESVTNSFVKDFR